MVLGEGKNSTDIILMSGSFIDEAMVARESTWLLLPLKISEISTLLN